MYSSHRHTPSLYQFKKPMQYGGGAMQYEHIFKIAAHVMKLLGTDGLTYDLTPGRGG